MNFIEILQQKALETVDLITDPVARAKAIADLLAAPLATVPFELDTKAANKPEEVKPPKAAKASKTKKAEKSEEVKVADEAPKVVEPAPQPVVEAKPEPVAEEVPVVEAPAPEIVAKVKATVEKVEPYMPVEGETAEQRQERQAVLVKVFGDMKLNEVLGDTEKKKFFAAEIKAIGAFRNFFLAKFGISFDAEGNEHTESGYTSQQVDETIHHYVHECDETGEKWDEIKVDKFITVFIPYMMNIYTLFSSYTDEQILAAGRRMIHNDNFSLGRINHENIDALQYLLNPEAKIG